MKRMYLLTAAAAAAAVLAALGLPRSALADAGYAFDVTVSTAGKAKEKPAAVVFKTVVSGPNARIEIPLAKDDWKKGDYLLTADGGKSFTLVSPSRKTVQTFDEAAVRALVEKENRGVSVGSPESAWTKTGADEERYTRRYAIAFREGLVSGKGTIDEVHDFTLAAPGTPGPAYNPMVTYTLLELAGLLLKDETFRRVGIGSVLPGGFVRQAILRVKTAIKASPFGSQKQETVTTLDSSAPVATEVPAAAFALPADYKIIKP